MQGHAEVPRLERLIDGEAADTGDRHDGVARQLAGERIRHALQRNVTGRQGIVARYPWLVRMAGDLAESDAAAHVPARMLLQISIQNRSAAVETIASMDGDRHSMTTATLHCDSMIRALWAAAARSSAGAGSWASSSRSRRA